MNGCVIEGTQIVVDMWKQPQKGKVFFLTHLHADHIVGLTSSFRFPFYTSPVNCSLLHQWFEFPENVVIPLELNQPHLIPLDSESGETMTVTLIDANHVPGAVMFLFQGCFGNILYCGDMRFHPDLLDHPVLKPLIEWGRIHRLYLDNTFCMPSYNFPSEEEAREELFNIISEYPNHTIKLGTRKLGKEKLLEAIAMKFNELIWVDNQRYEQLKILKRPDVYTNDVSKSRIHVLNISRIHKRTHERWNEREPTITISLTAVFFGVPKEDSPFDKAKGLFVVPYSNHSSWGELFAFVQAVKPQEIIPIVKINKRKNDIISTHLRSIDDMTVFNHFLTSPASSPLPTSTSVSKKQSAHIDDKYLKNKQPAEWSRPIRRPKCIPYRRSIPLKGVNYSEFEESEEGAIMDCSETQVDGKNEESCNVHSCPLPSKQNAIDDTQSEAVNSNTADFTGTPYSSSHASPNTCDSVTEVDLLRKAVEEVGSLVSFMDCNPQPSVKDILQKGSEFNETLHALTNTF